MWVLCHLVKFDFLRQGVDFCGYSVPHPLEDKVLIRIQTKPGVAAAEILLTALDNLNKIFETVETKFEAAYDKFKQGQE